MAITAKELLELKLDGFSTLQDIFDIYDGEAQFGSYVDVDGVEYRMGSKDGFYVELAQKIIDAVTKEK